MKRYRECKMQAVERECFIHNAGRRTSVVRSIRYAEFLCSSSDEQVFGWKFTDYGPDYTSFGDGRLAGGFSKERGVASGGPLIVIYGHDLAATERKVVDAGGHISRETFSFPGGRRFHCTDTNGNELAVWFESA